jgi:hypothetical protein
MSEVVGCCGITCSECEVYKATQRNDDKARALILNRHKERFSEAFYRLYGREYQLEDINCDGCPTRERVFWYIDDCEIRACALSRNHENCAQCSEYPCVILEKFFKRSYVDAKKKLDEIRNKLE